MAHILEDLKAFLDSSPTSYHAARQLADRLALQEFIPLSEKENWHLEEGKRYFVLRGGSLCAFALPSSKIRRAVILGSHTDSPALKLKPHPEVQKENTRFLSAEVYGSPLLSSWLNRDLCLAGRVIVSNTEHQIEEKIVLLDDAPLFIPQLAIHLDREVNEKGLVLNKQEHLVPLAGLMKGSKEGSSYLETLLKRHISFKSLLGFDLFFVPMEHARFLGPEGELLTSYRLDNLCGAHACATALGLAEKPQPHLLQIGMFWDHEEIGSRTAEGAGSPFLKDILKRIALSVKMDEEQLMQCKNDSLLISVDAAHAFNPNYANRYEPNHLPLLGRGPVIKYNADHKYTTTATTAAIIVQAAQNLNLSLQSYITRGDLSCGSTIGPVVSHQLGIPAVDIGAPLLSMHSIRETIACKDHLDLCSLLAYTICQK